MQQYGVLHSVLDVDDSAADPLDQRVQVRAELTDVVVLLRLRIQDDRLKREPPIWRTLL